MGTPTETPAEWVWAEEAIHDVRAVMGLVPGAHHSAVKLRLVDAAKNGVRTCGVTIDGHVQDIPPERWDPNDWQRNCPRLPGLREVYFNRADLVAYFRRTGDAPEKPASPGRRGRKPKFDWLSILAEATRRVVVEGYPDNELAFVKSLLNWCHERYEDAPELSTMRAKVLKFLATTKKELRP